MTAAKREGVARGDVTIYSAPDDLVHLFRPSLSSASVFVGGNEPAAVRPPRDPALMPAAHKRLHRLP